MSVLVPQMSGTPPWDAWLYGIMFTCAKDSKKPQALFRAIQSPTRAFIIAGWNTETEIGLWYNGEPIFRDAGVGGLWNRFGDEYESEDPPIYYSFSHIKKLVTKLRKELGEKPCELPGENMSLVHIGLALWQHPDSHGQPLEEYLLMSGFKFPGSPRR